MWFIAKILIVTCWLTAQSTIKAYDVTTNEVISVNLLNDSLIQEINSHAPIVRSILSKAINGSFKSRPWHELAAFVDKFGPRISGSQALEDSIDYVLKNSKVFGLENVHGETVQVPHWVRGNESATLLRPWKKNLAILGLGYSVGTPEEGITAKAIVVNSFLELKRRASEVPGKIVVYNQKFRTYGETVKYRSSGAARAAELGAVAVLIRSITPFSIYTPHTGMQSYEANITKIPAACITVEDAQLLKRMSYEAEIEINLKMEAQNMPETESRNVVAEIIGTEKPDHVVVISGHIDSWDVGQGAMDDGGGAFIAWNALQLLKSLNLRPRRTIRMIMWTAEELGIVGAEEYIKQHQADEGKLQFVMESDMGTFEPVGLKFTGSEVVKEVLSQIMTLLEPMGFMGLTQPIEGPDINTWIKRGVPGASLWTKNSEYFWYHHTNADTMLLEDPGNLDKGTAIFAAVSYVLADLSIDLPRH